MESAGSVERHAIFVAGPDGSGKTTFVNEFLAELPFRYLSADLIAATLSPERPDTARIRAGREFLLQLKQTLFNLQDFVLETTLSGRSLQSSLKRLRNKGYRTSILFVFLDKRETRRGTRTKGRSQRS